ncbi:MAG: AAA family ATPase [Candidatus Nanohaloarchaea archaeon]|nr:AAA family ATPase [Candidatus Nanohaloarchaea archaeon]
MDAWLEKQGWEENPFNFKIYPDLLVGYDDEIKELEESIDADNKFSIVLGKTGAGKTNLLRWLAAEYEGHRDVYYMPKPPTDNGDLLAYLKDEILQPGLISRFFRSYSLYNIHDELQASLSGPTLLIIDEGHEASTDVLKWIRTAIDHVEDLSVIAAGLPSFEETLQEEVHTLYSRATNVLRLECLDRDESIELIRERIAKAGGSPLEPFTQQAVMTIYERTRGFPREVLRACNDCVVHASREDLSIIDESDVKKIVDDIEGGGELDVGDHQEERPAEEKEGLNLTDKQEEVLEVLREEGRSTSGDVADVLGADDYTSRDHAVRSINNILKRLMENGIVDRERDGRSYVYFVEE